MKKLFILVAVTVCLCACKEEKLAVAGSGWNDIAIINKKTGVTEWKHSLEAGGECNAIEVTRDGNVLIAYSKGAKLITRNHETVWDYKANENEEIHSASRLKDGSFLIGVCGEPARIVELNAKGDLTHEVRFNTLIFDIHYQFRQIVKLDDGNYLVPLIGKQKIIRLTPDGNLNGTIYTASDLFSVIPLKNGNLLVSCGRSRRFIEIDPEHQQRENIIETREIQGGLLGYVAEIVLYKNGNKLIANSNMYSNNRSQPLLIEIDEENNVVWQLPYNKEIKNITSVCSFYE